MTPRSERRVRFTPEDDAKMLALSAAGKTGREIGQALGDRQASSINNRLRLLRGLVRPPRPELARVAEKAPGGAAQGVVKRLGGCGGTFLSPDRFRIRICRSCKKRASERGSGLPEAFALAI